MRQVVDLVSLIVTKLQPLLLLRGPHHIIRWQVCSRLVYLNYFTLYLISFHS